MQVLFAASEVHPFVKTGGLADVAGALPRALARHGLEVTVALPYHRAVRDRGDEITLLREGVPCPFAGSDRPFHLLETQLSDAPGVRFLLIDQPDFFQLEDAIYGHARGPTGLGHLRYIYFSRALLRVVHAASLTPDVLHLNDWQTGLVPPLLRTVHRDDARMDRIATVMTIHNIAYQGVYPDEMLREAGLPEWLLAQGRLGEKGLGNLLAGGLRFADAINTVSETYAREILTPEFGQGLEGLLQWRRDLLRGIVNGLDTEVWDPARDPALPAHFDAEDLTGKKIVRDRLLEEMGLEPTEGPVFGVVSRLVEQKGLDLVPPVFSRVLLHRPDARLVVLGSGEPALEASFRELAERFGGRVGVRFAFDPGLASRIEGGIDFFLMPSRFEPCGLNQLISMRYASPPIVRAVGGLADTVVDASPENLRAGRATGFRFEEDDPRALATAVGRALALFDRPDDLAALRRGGLATDVSWARSAGRYVALYEEAIARHREGDHLEPILKDLPAEPLELELPPLYPVPLYYPRDGLTAVAVDPETLFAQWEISGEKSAGRIFSLPEEAREGLRLVLHVASEDGTIHDRHEYAGQTREAFVPVVPGHAYRVRLALLPPGRGEEELLEHDAVDVPRALRPGETAP